MPACEASHYLQLWDSDAPLKPRGFDAATSMRLHGVADIAAVSAGASGQLGLAGCCSRQGGELGAVLVRAQPLTTAPAHPLTTPAAPPPCRRPRQWALEA